MSQVKVLVASFKAIFEVTPVAEYVTVPHEESLIVDGSSVTEPAVP